jgi:MFS family permease
MRFNAPFRTLCKILMNSPAPHTSSLRYFFLSRVATTLSTQMLMVIVAWQMYDMTGSAYDLGLVGLVQFVPALALSLFVGQVADRHDRRLVLLACVLGQSAVAALLVAGTWGGWLSRAWILAASRGLGVAKAFQMPTQQAVLGAISLDLFAVLFGGVTALLPVFARDVLHTGTWALGPLRSAPCPPSSSAARPRC